MNSRPYYESELGALRSFHACRALVCPDSESEVMRNKAGAYEAAMELPESALPILLFMAASAHGPTFREFLHRIKKP